jgi:hypothetical protein
MTGGRQHLCNHVEGLFAYHEMGHVFICNQSRAATRDGQREVSLPFQKVGISIVLTFLIFLIFLSQDGDRN